MRLYSRPGNDLTHRFPLIVETLIRLGSRSCIIDGEAVACDEHGVASFNLVRYRRRDESTFLYAFDLIELNGDDLRRDPLESRRATLEMILAKAGSGIRFNEHMEGDGETVFRHACKLGLEGIVSKRKDSAYRSGRSSDWLKMKNANAPAVKREERGRLGQTEMAMIEAGGRGLILKRASASRPSGQWNDDHFDVACDGAVVGRIFKANAAPVGSPWIWTLAFEQHKHRSPTHGYASTREAAMRAFAKSWRRE